MYGFLFTGIRYWACFKCSGEEEMGVTFTRRNSLIYHPLMDNDIPRYICPVSGYEKKHTHHQRVLTRLNVTFEGQDGQEGKKRQARDRMGWQLYVLWPS
ncbi:hypothetical protein PoB_000819700 [Plakobranchus ocellatus]|uniref:Nanos-type domain-containing protein n=1 Tax=Plakobranchus ocellatus TaxID=259542 RepID=A0AAV3YFR1_9GAST|nr:hypothetical protein PoB_000819700 [Plakobranchus ocellatus]